MHGVVVGQQHVQRKCHEGQRKAHQSVAQHKRASNARRPRLHFGVRQASCHQSLAPASKSLRILGSLVFGPSQMPKK